MNFYFPTQVLILKLLKKLDSHIIVLKTEDYAPVQVLVLKEYYKNLFNSLLDEVNHIL